MRAERKVAGRIRWTPWQRFTIVLAARVAPAWREATLLIQPATIVFAFVANTLDDWKERSLQPLRRVTQKCTQSAPQLLIRLLRHRCQLRIAGELHHLVGAERGHGRSALVFPDADVAGKKQPER